MKIRTGGMVVVGLVVGAGITVASAATGFDGQWKPSIDYEGSADPVCDGFIFGGNVLIRDGGVSGNIQHTGAQMGFDMSGQIGSDGSLNGVLAQGRVATISFAGTLDGRSGMGKWESDQASCRGNWRLEKVE